MSNLILDRPVVRRELPKPQTWLLFGPSSASTADGRTSLQDRPAITLDPRAKDLTDQKFGRLTALRPVGRRETSLLWLCQCSCGHFFEATSNNLTGNRSKSCGCLRSEAASRRQFKNLRGQRFGRLIVIEFAGKDKRGYSLWQCLCTCNKTTTVRSSGLIQGRINSCGCLQKEKSRQRTGPKNPSWNPLLTDEDRANRRFGIAQVRNQVFLRDGYLCTLCGKHGKALNAHHMEPWSKNPALRFDPDNMVTLCNSCHMTYHRDFPAKTANSANFVSWFRQRKVKPPHHSPLAWSSPESVGAFSPTPNTKGDPHAHL